LENPSEVIQPEDISNDPTGGQLRDTTLKSTWLTSLEDTLERKSVEEPHEGCLQKGVLKDV
jgi:hypothetical protein